MAAGAQPRPPRRPAPLAPRRPVPGPDPGAPRQRVPWPPLALGCTSTPSRGASLPRPLRATGVPSRPTPTAREWNPMATTADLLQDGLPRIAETRAVLDGLPPTLLLPDRPVGEHGRLADLAPTRIEDSPGRRVRGRAGMIDDAGHPVRRLPFPMASLGYGGHGPPSTPWSSPAPTTCSAISRRCTPAPVDLLADVRDADLDRVDTTRSGPRPAHRPAGRADRACTASNSRADSRRRAGPRQTSAGVWPYPTTPSGKGSANRVAQPVVDPHLPAARTRRPGDRPRSG